MAFWRRKKKTAEPIILDRRAWLEAVEQAATEAARREYHRQFYNQVRPLSVTIEGDDLVVFTNFRLPEFEDINGRPVRWV